ncbi:EamA family transporter [Blastococcus montanus]|uniref:EamA family transporter n=1 Tax=Blastococcus montanus TaxID=3144973 RepID=UPI00387ED929
MHRRVPDRQRAAAAADAAGCVRGLGLPRDGPVHVGPCRRAGIPSLHAGQWVWLGVAGGTTGAATACMYAALAQASASRVAVVLALQTLVALTLGAWLLGEPVGAVQLLGIVAILSAVSLAGRAHQRPAAP